MSVELEWELYDIFDSGTFAFPIYDHSSARKIVRYLLMRGILHEEIAEAIEESTGDLMMWLNRNGKHKVGEWVIAWVNDCREDFDRGELHKMGEEGGDSEFDADFFLRDDDSDSDDGGGPRRGYDGAGEDEKRSDSRITELESISSQAATSRSSAETLDKTSACKPTATGNHVHHHQQQQRDIYHLAALDSPPKTMTRPTDLDLTECNSSTEALYDAPDSGHFSDLYTTIPSDSCAEQQPATSCAAKLLGAIDPSCTMHGSQRDHDPASECTCSVPHYSFVRKNTTATKTTTATTNLNHLVTNLPQLADTGADQRIYDIFFADTLSCAMRLDFATLDQDGPGFVYIMTDSIVNCLPWSSEHRYKISSSRQPDRCLIEFRSRNVDVDLIWQVKVKQHLKAVREIHTKLNEYNLYSNWFKCSLSLIMDTVSKVVKHYK